MAARAGVITAMVVGVLVGAVAGATLVGASDEADLGGSGRCLQAKSELGWSKHPVVS